MAAGVAGVVVHRGVHLEGAPLHVVLTALLAKQAGDFAELPSERRPHALISISYHDHQGVMQVCCIPPGGCACQSQAHIKTPEGFRKLKLGHHDHQGDTHWQLHQTRIPGLQTASILLLSQDQSCSSGRCRQRLNLNQRVSGTCNCPLVSHLLYQTAAWGAWAGCDRLGFPGSGPGHAGGALSKQCKSDKKY